MSAPLETRKCLACGNTFSILQSEGRKNGRGKFCSRNCAALARTKPAQHWAMYEKWRSMIRRCHQPTHLSYKNYGARGIVVCERWRQSFFAFVQDMGLPPTPLHTLDRKDNDGDYTPENCRWATASEQQRNRRNSRRVPFNGEAVVGADLAERFGMSPETFYNRSGRYGWDVERALKQPVRKFVSPETIAAVRAGLAAGRSKIGLAREHRISQWSVLRISRQCERERVDMATLCGDIEEGSVPE